MKYIIMQEDDRLRQWMCLLAAHLWSDCLEAKLQAIAEGIPDKLRMLLRDPVPEVWGIT